MVTSYANEVTHTQFLAIFLRSKKYKTPPMWADLSIHQEAEQTTQGRSRQLTGEVSDLELHI